MATSFRLAPNGFNETHVATLEALIASSGTGCLASGPTAAALHRLPGFRLRPPFDVIVPRGRFVSRVGHRVHTSTDLALLDRADICGIPVLSPTRTVIDLARTEPVEGLERVVQAAFDSGISSEDFLFRRIGALRRSGRYGIPALVEVLAGNELRRGGRTWLEAEVLRLLLVAGVPTPSTEVVLARRATKLVRVDFHWPKTGVVLEALGYRWHRSAPQMQVDAERMNALQLAGQLVLQCTYRDVVAGAATVIGDLRRALALDRAA